MYTEMKEVANMRRKNNEIKDQETLMALLKTCDVIRVAMCVDQTPYIVPMNFGYKDHTFYFHGAKEGRKIEMIKINPKVAFELDTDHVLVGQSDRACDWTMKFSSIIGSGFMHIVEDRKEKIEALNILMQHYEGKEAYDYEDKMIERIGILKLEVSEMTGKRS